MRTWVICQTHKQPSIHFKRELHVRAQLFAAAGRNVQDQTRPHQKSYQTRLTIRPGLARTVLVF
jgi:hypothetical protein